MAYIGTKRRGFGDDLTSRCAGYTTMQYVFAPPCWSHTPAEWRTLATLPLPPVPAPPAGPSTVQEETVPGAFTPDQAIAGGVAATQAQNAAFFQGVPMLPTDDGGGLSVTSLIGLGLGLGIVVLAFSGSGRRR